jgi:hypothetical protein
VTDISFETVSVPLAVTQVKNCKQCSNQSCSIELEVIASDCLVEKNMVMQDRSGGKSSMEQQKPHISYARQHGINRIFQLKFRTRS